MYKWLIVILVVILAVVTAVVGFTITGVIQPQHALLEYAKTSPSFKPYFDTYEIGKTYEEYHERKLSELKTAQLALAEELAQVAAERDRLLEFDNRLQQQANQLTTNQAYQQSIERLAEMYTTMRPAEAAKIFEHMEEELLLSILLAMDSETASLILVELPPKLSASLSSHFR